MLKNSMSKKNPYQFALNFNNSIAGSSRASAAAAGKEASVVLPPKKRKMRMAAVGLLAVLWVCGVGVRLYYLQVADTSRWQSWATKQHFADIELASERGPILDRDGKLLAVSVPAGSIYIRPKQITDKEKTASQLAALLEMDRREILKKMGETSPFVWIRRQLPRAIADKVANLKLTGVNYVLESKRFYPFSASASTLIGKSGVDGNGLSGIERLYEKQLHEQSKKQRVVRDAYGNSIQLTGAGASDPEFELPKGTALNITLDTDIQQIVDEETELGESIANAKSVAAVMVDPETGEILAMSQSKSPNFNLAGTGSQDELKNKLVEAVFEPGSIFKPLVAAGAIEDGIMKTTDMVNCENGKYPFMKHIIKDVHPSGVIPFFDVVVRSSNIGMTKVGIRLGKERLYNWIRKFGFGSNTKLGLAGETGGILRNVNSWSGVDVATHSFGQGVAVTPLQIVRAVSAIANGGRLPNLKLIKGQNTEPPVRIISENTAHTVQEMMYGVVEDEHGTGGKATIEGLRVGGKTGTAQKARADGKGYAAGSYVASFVGFVDLTDVGITRKLVLAVMVDEPHTGTIYGGALAAPVFRRVIQRSVHMLMTRENLEDNSNEIEKPINKILTEQPLLEANYRQDSKGDRSKERVTNQPAEFRTVALKS